MRWGALIENDPPLNERVPFSLIYLIHNLKGCQLSESSLTH